METQGPSHNKDPESEIITELKNKLETTEKDLEFFKREVKQLHVNQNCLRCQELKEKNEMCLQVIEENTNKLASYSIEKFDKECEIKQYKCEIDRMKSELMKSKNQRQNEYVAEINRLKKELQCVLKHEEELERDNCILNMSIKSTDLKMQQSHTELQKLQKAQKQLEMAQNQTTAENKDLLLRLSKIASANLTHNNPNIADLSDLNRPTKLAEKFSELYDNQWTDAFETLNMADETATIQCLIDILRTINKHCVGITTQQSVEMLKMLTSVRIKYARRSNCQDSHVSKTDRHPALTMQAAEMPVIYSGPHMFGLEPPLSVKTSENVDVCVDPCAEIEDETNVCNDGRKKSVNEPECSNQTNTTTDVDTAKADKDNETVNVMQCCIPEKAEVSNGTTVSNEKDFTDKLSTAGLKNIGDIRKQLQRTMKEDIIQMVTSAVIDELELNIEANKALSGFIKECASLCWEMRLHDPPMHLEFIDVNDATPFDSSVYKAYTKSGKMLDYVVWPSLYLHEGGPLLNKGVAQGK